MRRKEGSRKHKCVKLKRRAKAEMSHHVANMSRVKYPADSLGEAITGIHNAGDLMKVKMTGFLPILKGKILDVDMSGSFGGAIGVCHFDC